MKVGVDGKKIRVQHTGTSYSSCLGVSVFYEGQYEKFGEKYEEALEHAFKEIGEEKDLEIYKSKDLMDLFGPYKKNARDFIGDFVGNLLDNENVKLGITFTDFNKSPLPEKDGNKCVYYFRGTGRVKEVPFYDYMDHLEQFYPQVTAFTSIEESGHKIFLDNIEGHPTRSWDALTGNHDVEIVPTGDKTNYMISAADLTTRYIELSLNEFNDFISRENIANSISVTDSNDFHVEKVSNGSLGYITPRSKDRMATHRKFPEKMVFVLLENSFKGERDYFENSTYYEAACKLANANNSGLKLLDLEQDAHMIGPNDLLVYTGPESKKKLERIENFDLGKPVSYKRIDEMV